MIRRASCTNSTSGVRRSLEGQDRPDRDHQPVPRRFRQTGSRGDRRARSGRRNAGAGVRYRRDPRQGRSVAGQLAEPVAVQQHALYFDDRLSGPQGQSQGDQGLARSGEARHVRWSCPIPRLPAARAGPILRRGRMGSKPGGKRRQRQGVHHQALQERAGAGFRRARSHHDFRRARNRRRAAGLGERGLPGAQGESAATSSTSSIPR